MLFSIEVLVLLLMHLDDSAEYSVECFVEYFVVCSVVSCLMVLTSKMILIEELINISYLIVTIYQLMMMDSEFGHTHYLTNKCQLANISHDISFQL